MSVLKDEKSSIIELVRDVFKLKTKEAIIASGMIVLVLAPVLYVFILIKAYKDYNEKIFTLVNYRFIPLLIAEAVVFTLVSIILIIQNRKKNKEYKPIEAIINKNEKMEAYIVEQDSPLREKIFARLNQHAVKKTYNVFGNGLAALIEKHAFINKLLCNNVNINICMIDPEVICDDKCKKHYSEYSKIMNLDHPDMEKFNEHIKGFFETADHLMEISVKRNYLRGYYNAKFDYSTQINASYISLEQIIQNAPEYVQDRIGQFAFYTIKSFLPMSITIIDEEEEDGEMIVEYYLPYTDKRMLIYVKKTDSPEVFQSFMEFYGRILKKSDEKSNNFTERKSIS